MNIESAKKFKHAKSCAEQSKAFRRSRRLKHVRMFATLLIILVGLSACPSNPVDIEPPRVAWNLRLNFSNADHAYLESLPVLRLGIDPQWAPMAFVNPEGRADGISADYLDFLQETLGVRFHVVPTHSWAETIALANKGELDVVAAVSKLDGLKSGFRLSEPYVHYPVVIVTRETAPFIGGAADLSGAEVAIVADADFARVPLPGAPKIHPLLVESAQDGLDAVANGRAFAYIGNLGVVDRLVREKYAGTLRVAAPAGYEQELSFAVAPHLAQLMPMIDHVLTSIPENEREHIQNSWLSSRFVFGVPARTLWIVLTPVAGITLMFLAVLFVNMQRLRKEVRQRRWTERELVFETQFKTLLMNTVPIPVFVKGADGTYLAVNPAYEEALGVRAEDLIGKALPDSGHVHELDLPTLNGITAGVVETGHAAHGEVRYRAPDGLMREAVYWARLCKTNDDMPRAVLGAFVDVSDLRRMERREVELKRQLVELTQALPSVVFQMRYSRDQDPRFDLVFVNQRAHDLMRSRQSAISDLFGTFLKCLTPEARFRVTRLFVRSVRSLEVVRTELELECVRGVGGGPTWMHLEAAPQTRDDDTIIWSGYLHDITEAKANQCELVAAKHSAEAASRARESFLATVSHEIRTPMSGVVGILQLLDNGRLSADDQHLVDMARNAAEILLRILNDILDFAKSENGELSLESDSISVADIVQRTAGIVAPELERKGLHFNVSVSRKIAPRLLGDAQRLGQVLLNLLGNAGKFTEYGEVSLTVDVAQSTAEKQALLLRVADTGIGIAAEDQARLFSPFSQARTASAGRYGGTGLGLAICKRLIESMGGTITLESELGRGTEIEIVLALPVDRVFVDRMLDEAAAAHPPEGHVTSPQEPGRRILLVDDHAINLEVLRRQLGSLRMLECDIASNGVEALKALERESYAMVITDCAMPVMDGVELMSRIRQRESGTRSGRPVTLVALTANATQQQRDACIAAGADEVYLKPVSVERLRELLDRYGISAPPITKLEKAGIPAERHTDLWAKLQRTLAAEMTALLALSLDTERAQAREIVHRVLGAASWFHLDEVADAATKLEHCLGSEAAAPHGQLFNLQTAIARVTAESAEAGAIRGA